MAYRIWIAALSVALGLSISVAMATAQTMYRYKDDNGNWQFSDRPPEDSRASESERMATRNRTPQIILEQVKIEGGIQLVATNEWHCPMELRVSFTNLTNISSEKGNSLTSVLPPDSTTVLREFFPVDIYEAYGIELESVGTPGDPTSKPSDYVYAMPFAKGTDFMVTQAYPSQATHNDPFSYHAIDFAMPVGTQVFAIRDGVVYQTAYDNFSGGTDPSRDLPKANVVRIAHDDGTIAVYAHLAWNAIRVKPGQRVKRGQYIANSGNTGFSSGPHLHLALLANTGAKLVSLPIRFDGTGNSIVTPTTGEKMFNLD